MADKPTEWCLFFIGPCLQSAEWASWAQALFSAAAVASAIGVVSWQLQVGKRQSAEAARLVASGMLTLMDQTIGGLHSVAQGLHERIQGQHSASNSLQHLVVILSMLPLPSKKDLLSLNSELPTCSVKLLRASNSVKQIKSALETLSTVSTLNSNQAMVPDLCKPLLSLTSEAEKSFTEVRQELDRFCPP